MHAVCLSVCLHVLYKAYFVVIPSKPLDHGPLVKNGLIVNKTIVVFIACVVIPDVPQQIWLIRMKLPLWINACRVEEQSVRLAYKTKVVTDWSTPLGH